MKKSLIAIGSVSLLCLALAASAVALQDDNPWFRQRATGVFVRRVERQLNITDAQREQIRTILKTEQPAITTLVARVREEQQQLHASDTFDEARVRAFAQEHVSTSEDVLVEREKVRTEIMQVLTPEQRKEAEQIRRKFSAQLADRLSVVGDQL
jgi:Spy/CpxP family protein refolding chaperone